MKGIYRILEAISGLLILGSEKNRIQSTSGKLAIKNESGQLIKMQVADGTEPNEATSVSQVQTMVAGGSNAKRSSFIHIDFNEAVTVIPVPENAIITQIRFIVDNAWVGGIENIEIIKSGGAVIVTGNEFDKSTNSITFVEVFVEMGSDTEVEVEIPSGITSGSGKLEITYYVNL